MAADRRQVASVLLGLISNLLACMLLNFALLNAEIGYARGRLDIYKLFTLSILSILSESECVWTGEFELNTPWSHNVWTRIFSNPERKTCGLKNIRIRVDGALEAGVSIAVCFENTCVRVMLSKLCYGENKVLFVIPFLLLAKLVTPTWPWPMRLVHRLPLLKLFRWNYRISGRPIPNFGLPRLKRCSQLKMSRKRRRNLAMLFAFYQLDTPQRYVISFSVARTTL